MGLNMKRMLLALMLGLLFSPWAFADNTTSFTTADGTELPYQDLKADSKLLYLLYPAEFGSLDNNIKLGKRLQQGGLHTWVLDLFTPYFLPVEGSSMDQLPARDLAGLIEFSHQKTGKPVVIVAYGRGAIPALRAGHKWLKSHRQADYFKGLIMLHPKLYVETPKPGETPKYMPIVTANQLPIYLLSPTKSPSRWRIDADAAALMHQGAPVFLELIKGVRNFYFNNPHPDEMDTQKAAELPGLLSKAAGLLNRLPALDIDQVAEIGQGPKRATPRIRGIEEVAKQPPAPEVAFHDTRGRLHRLSDYRGKVVLLNFWATWCPPCVHEMPSMDRLQESLHGEDFAIMAVNMAEEPQTVRTFLKRDVHVSFPVLLDSKGLALKDYEVFVYPTSYIIDKQGRIRSAMYGAIDWDTDEVRARLRALMKE
jgi:thiol-disulfide isomerase/thioredoxin